LCLEVDKRTIVKIYYGMVVTVAAETRSAAEMMQDKL
jgi:hypothetical protein